MNGVLVTGRLRLIALSFLMLFVELALIRWTGSNVVHLSYFSNFVLLGSFLGIGIGFLRANRKRNGFVWAPSALAVLVGFVLVFPVEIDRSGSALIYFGSFESTGLPTWVTLPVIFIACATVMALIAEGVARTFVTFEPLEAYRLDVLGSILGIVAFAVLSFLGAPPVVWGALTAGLFTVLLDRLRWPTALVLLALVGMLGAESLSDDVSWSPYYKVSLVEQPAGTDVYVNGVPHQAIESTEVRRQLEPIYFLPYERRRATEVDDVLIVGAGNGTDVAIALEQGARRVDAVEIDPRIAELGKELHPDRPYDDPRVHLYVDDGRAFLERTDRKYDLVLFALPDSLTLVSGQSSLRLESYLFTTEAIREARKHLAPGGVFAMYNYYREDWLLDRLARTLQRAYGHEPCVETVGSFGRLALLSAADVPAAIACPSSWTPLSSSSAEPVNDDYPFLYLESRSVPGFYLLTIALILLGSAALTRVFAGPFAQMKPYADLFFMGAAFLLLETKNVVQFALLFGTTWVVNALVFAGILVCVLAAVEVSKRVTFRRPAVLYLLLLASLVVAWTVPQHYLLGLSVPLRFAAAVALAFTPVFLANLVFAQRFKETASSAIAFGANLLGAMCGGLLEYASLVVGYRALLIVIAGLYAAAFVLGRESLRPTTTSRARA